MPPPPFNGYLKDRSVHSCPAESNDFFKKMFNTKEFLALELSIKVINSLLCGRSLFVYQPTILVPLPLKNLLYP